MAQASSLEKNDAKKESAPAKQGFFEAVTCLTRALETVQSAVDQWGNLPVLESKKHFINTWLRHVAAHFQKPINSEFSDKRGESQCPPL